MNLTLFGNPSSDKVNSCMKWVGTNKLLTSQFVTSNEFVMF